jgi:hypothetical protein
MMKNYFFLLIFLAASILHAQPTTISYQGVLYRDYGATFSGSRNIRFDIFYSLTGGTSQWNETHYNVEISKGLFEVQLGSVIPFGNLDFSRKLWLEITVQGDVLSPRIAFNASNYAMYVNVAKNVIGGEAGSIPYQSGLNTTSMLAPGSDGKVLTLSGGIPSWESIPAATVTSVAGKTGVVTLDKDDIGLGNVDNTSDADKPVSTATQTALNGKVDKISGKGLSTEDYTSAEKIKLAGIAENANNYVHPTGDGNLHVPATGTTNNGKVLTAGVTEGSLSWATPYSCLTNFTESNYSYNTKTGVKFTPNNGAANVDFVLQPKGTGAILAQQPDGTAAGGNNRGDGAVDLQTSRLFATLVASGDYSVLSGGLWNTASGSGSTVAGGSSNIASGSMSSIGGGSSISAGGNNSTVAGGLDNSASGDYSTVAGGEENEAGGDYSLATGYGNTAQSYGETVIGIYATVGSGTPGSRVDGDRLFVVGNGTGFSSRKDALKILKNGNTIIGGSLALNGNGTNSSFIFPTGRGTNGQVLQTDGSGGTSWTTPYSGLTNFTESSYGNGSTINYGSKFLAKKVGQSNVDFVIQPKGTGAILAQQPDGTATGGNKRGVYAVDFQLLRFNADQVASGDYSVIGGGRANSASGYYSKIGGGYYNSAEGQSSTIGGGNDNSAEGQCSTIGGGIGNSTVTLYSTIGGGYFNSAEGQTSTIGGGHSNTASGNYSTIGGGYDNSAEGLVSTIGGGRDNRATGEYSTAFGRGAYAYGDYSFAINLGEDSGPIVTPLTFRISGANQIGGNVAWTNYSDKRLKKDIVYISDENNLDKIMSLNAVRFRWKANDELLNLGFIAQETENIIPESVRYDEINDIYSMEYTAIIPVLVEGMKEQQKMIDDLQKEIAELRKELTLSQNLNEAMLNKFVELSKKLEAMMDLKRAEK